MIGSAALIIIGSELTRGIIQDRHGQLVSRAVSSLGIHMSQIVAIPDDGSIGSILSAIVRKNDLVVITGGLGPTSDDMTRQCIADVAAAPLERDEECWKDLYGRIGDRIYGANEKQTLIPRGFVRIRNANGTADGFYGYCPSGCLVVSRESRQRVERDTGVGGGSEGFPDGSGPGLQDLALSFRWRRCGQGPGHCRLAAGLRKASHSRRGHQRPR